jgi:hypothetical protein
MLRGCTDHHCVTDAGPEPEPLPRSNIMNYPELGDIGDGEILFRLTDNGRECGH